MNVVIRNRRVVATIAVLLAAAAAAASDPAPALPERLSETGLYSAGTLLVHPGNFSYTPQYPLWSDGAAKRRWLYLPSGSTIDASNPDAWQFPPGTRLWKEFSLGQRVETRMIERLADGTWRYATYVWNDEQTEAFLAQDGGHAAYPVAAAPGGRYAIPSRDDCLACHEGAAVPVLGVTALQLSHDRDESAPHAEAPGADDIDLRSMVARGLIANLPPALLDKPPRIAASSPTGRSALGYLHANCGHCHNDAGPLSLLEMVMAQDSVADIEKVLRTLLGKRSDFRLHGMDTRIVPGQPGASVLALRMKSRDPLTQMPPLGTQLADAEGLALIERWIQQDLLYDWSNYDETS